MAGPQQRAFPRFAVQVTVEIITSARVVLRGVSHNISHGGLCVDTSQALSIGDEVGVRLTLVFDADRSSEPLALPARVVWCTAIGPRYQLGTQFRPLSREQTTYLDMFMRYLDDTAMAGKPPEPSDNGDDEGDPFAD